MLTNIVGMTQNNTVKERLILDLIYVNKLLCIPKFKYEDSRTARDTFTLRNWFF